MKIINYKSKRILCISNTYGRHRSLIIPKADIVIHAGDTCKDGDLNQLIDFFEWFSSLKIKRKIFVAGEHDLKLVLQPEILREMIPACVIYLENELIDYDGITFYGLAVRPIMPKKLPIPMYVDILISHGPPLGILDKHKGCPILKQTIKELEPSIHVFGHVHSLRGKTLKAKKRTFYNVVSLSERKI